VDIQAVDPFRDGSGASCGAAEASKKAPVVNEIGRVGTGPLFPVRGCVIAAPLGGGEATAGAVDTA